MMIMKRITIITTTMVMMGQYFVPKSSFIQLYIYFSVKYISNILVFGWTTHIDLPVSLTLFYNFYNYRLIVIIGTLRSKMVTSMGKSQNNRI